MKKIEISELKKELDLFDKKIMIIGQPKKVGLTTEIVEYFCEKLFFEESFSLLFLVDNPKSKSEIVELFEKTLFFNYDYKTSFDFSKNVLTVFNNNLSLINYKKKEITTLSKINKEFKYNISYIEKDDDNEILNYYITEYLPLISKQQIIATYDTEKSIFYIPKNDEYITKIIVYSQLSITNIKNLNNIDSYTHEYEKIIKGLFNNEDTF